MGRLIDNFQVGAFSVEVSRNRLMRGSEAFALEPQVMNVLCALAENPDQVISREDLIDRVWKVEHGADESLTRAISQLRKTFREAGEKDRYIETIYTRGYRLIVPVIRTEKNGLANETIEKISLAVLAFEDMSPKKDQEHFSDGISEEIINALVRLSYLRVSGRTSSFSFKGKQIPLRDIATTLKVTHILEGSVRKHEGQLRISVQLIEAEDDNHLWSGIFEGSQDEIFDLQERIARAVKLKFENLFSLPDADISQRLAGVITKSNEAYDVFLQGRALAHQRDGQNTLPRAVELLKKAVELDPDFDEALAFLARANFYVLEHSTTTNWRDNITVGRAAAAKALELSPDSPLVYSTLAYQALLDLDVHARLKFSEKAYELEPTSPTYEYTFGTALASIGQSKRGLKLMASAVDKEPLSASWICGMGHAYFGLDDSASAIDCYHRSFALGYDSALFNEAIVLSNLGRPDAAVRIMEAKIDILSPIARILLGSFIRRQLIYAACCHGKPIPQWIVSRMNYRRVNDLNFQPSSGLTGSCYVVGNPGLFIKSVKSKPSPYLGGTLAQLWTSARQAKQIRDHSDFPKFAQDIGLVRAWQQYGWPKTIQPIEGTDGSNGQFVCT